MKQISKPFVTATLTSSSPLWLDYAGTQS